MKRSLQEYVELVVFGLIALLVGTGLLWVGGWVLSLLGIVLKGLAGLLWMLLRFVVPVAIAAGLVYFLVKAAQGRQRSGAGSDAGTTPVPAAGASRYTPPAAGTTDATTSLVDGNSDANTDLVTEFDAADVTAAASTDTGVAAADAVVVDEDADAVVADADAYDVAAYDVDDSETAVDEAADGASDDSAEDLEGDENDRT